jgi:hypothetical protein|tara:strand:- start:829 stop:1368 length:540 start_codon:yes stop_codon:yes gene_type:complete
MLVVNTISKIDVFMGRSSVDLIALRNEIDEWLNSATPMGSYDPLTELYEDAPDESYCPKSSIVEELIEEIQNEFKGLTGQEIEHVDHWVHVHYKNMSTEVHNHYPYDVSCVFYLTVPKGSGSLVFLPSHNKFHPPRIPFHPEEGQFLLFPAILDHTVTRNQSEHKRISISFNFKILNQD